MRDIRFRAWDGKRMLNRTLFDRNWYTWDDKCVKVAMPHDVNTLEIMQFTGLKDSKGNDIYESDILKTDSNITGSIEFHNGAFCWTDGACYWWLHSGHKNMSDDDKVIVVDDLEVIGNIYSNPELVEGNSND